jgi:3-phenylpropionate/trans-cinnamate dioxygenase ferredoxin subunit
MPEFVTVAKVTDVKPGKIQKVEVDGRAIALANWEGTLYAVEDTCPHVLGPASLSDGELQDGCIMCPNHASLFDLKTGAIVRNPADRPLKVFPVVVEGDDVKVSTTPSN